MLLMLGQIYVVSFDGLNLNLNINLTEYVISLYMDLKLQISVSFARTISFMLLSVLSSKISLISLLALSFFQLCL